MKSLVLLLIFSLLVACAPSVTSTPTWETLPTDTVIIPSETSPPTQTLIPPTSTKPSATETATPVPPTDTPALACVTLIYEEYAQFEIIDSNGQRVLIDVYDPEKLTSPAVAADILLTTHTHWDHLNPGFQAAFPGEQLFLEAGALSMDDVEIQGLASAHNAGDPFKPEGGTNYIYVLDIGDLRIVHFGDIGQNLLTEEQLVALGQVDVALTQLNNSFSEMNAENQKGIKLMEQLQPRLIMPTHLNLDTAKLAIAKWEGFYAETPMVQICKTDLSEKGMQILFAGEAAEMMIKYVELMKWGGE
jgi:L-ascorbate metabolism protein UlaG (beta-lactamase superfamily)